MDHEHIVKFHACDIVDNEIYLYLEYCNQGSLYDEIYGNLAYNASDSIEKGSGITDIGLVKRYLRQTIEALAYLHSIDIVHRGMLKLSNRKKTSNQPMS
jgi:serine/threonine protein kinase